ncbi:hypothetical protein [Fimbriiglobus ruber]|nr:hypothetical protein [Fimbriiglobus ruber]
MDEFSKNSRNKTTGKCAKCKACNALYERENKERISKRTKLYRERVRVERSRKQKAYRDERKDKARDYHKAYYAANKQKLIRRERARYQAKRETILEQCRLYSKNNRAKVNALHSKRKAMQKQAIPSWVDFEAIRVFYEKAKELTRKTGIEYEVDHIVPIRSRRVCGLHCQQNLQVITAVENNRKNNSFWPDMA